MKNNFWNLILIILLVIVCAVGGDFLYEKYLIFGEFQWGVTMRPASLGNYHPSIWKKQVALAKQLNVGYVRVGWDYNDKVNAMKINDGIIKIIEDAGIKPVLVIEQDPATITEDNYQEGYNNGYDIASHFKGRIKLYQMANEGSAQVLEGHTANGQEESHYNINEYNKLLSYLKGLSDGISKADPIAKKIVSMVYTHYVYLDWLKRDGLKYDYIGIDWYDWMGKFEEKKLETGQLLFDKLKGYKKPMVFAEINHLPEVDPNNNNLKTVVDEDKQASFISEEANWAWKNRKFIKGFYVLELIDNVNTKYPEYFGIVKAEKNSSGVYLPGELRKAYGVYRNVILKHK